MSDSLRSLFGITKHGQMDLNSIRSQQWGRKFEVDPISGHVNLHFDYNQILLEDCYVAIVVLRHRILIKHCQ